MGEPTTYEFEDSEGYKKGEDKLSIRQIILNQLQKCMTEGSKEMVRGGTIKRIVGGKTMEIAIPNQREVFINSVEMLKIPLLRRFKHYCNKKGDNDIKDIFGSTEKELKELKEDYIKVRNAIVSNKNKNENINATNTRVGSIYNDFEIRKVEIYKQFLMAVSYLLDEENYFEEVSATFGV